MKEYEPLVDKELYHDLEESLRSELVRIVSDNEEDSYAIRMLMQNLLKRDEQIKHILELLQKTRMRLNCRDSIHPLKKYEGFLGDGQIIIRTMLKEFIGE